jgi:uroporphyrinogen-III synthase
VQKKFLASSPLRDRGILVTRPREQAAGLARLIEEAGGRAHLFPAIAIEDLPAPAALARLQEFDLAVFVSPTAVGKTLGRMGAWPAAVRAAAVGAGTRRELERYGVANVIAPDEGADSEALLGEPELAQVANRRIVIFRGEGGRALLGDTLRERGAQVEYAACYRRKRPETGPLDWKREQIDAVTVSSAQGLANLFEMLDRAWLRARPLFVPHPRIAADARARAVQEVLVAGPSDEQMRDALVAYFRSHG